MRCAVDLHVHSRYAGRVSPEMTPENLAVWGVRKGIDIIGTGDCLHPGWLVELEEKLVPAEPGLWTPAPEFDRVFRKKLPPILRERALRFVLTVEASCLTMRGGKPRRVHHLLFFPRFENVRWLQRKIASRCILELDGRPTLRLSSRELLRRVCDVGDDCHLAPAHVLNAPSSVLGSQDGAKSLEAFFGDLTPRVLAVEIGLPSSPAMCRRLSSLDPFALFATSDAHSLPNIGREYTLLAIEPDYRGLFAALRRPRPENFAELVKTPLSRTHCDRDFCPRCDRLSDTNPCPDCGAAIVPGLRSRVEQIADRSEPVFPSFTPPCRFRMPLAEVIADQNSLPPKHEGVQRLHKLLGSELGTERYILDEAPFEAIAAVSAPPLARAILAQRGDRAE